MAAFCEALAETAVVAEACDEAGMGISGAYALRRRNPFFAAAWDAALTIARERLADTLLARSMEGNVEQIWRGGELVGERPVLDNRLGLAILRRLDRLAETGAALHSNPPPFPGAGRGPGAQRFTPAVLPRSQPFDWDMMVGALRTGDPDDVAQALALLEGHKVEEVEDPSNRPPSCDLRDDEPEPLDLTDRCWKDGIDDIWQTDFPPPPDFTGYESRPYDEDDEERYERACTEEEIAILEADRARGRAVERVEDEELRDAWFAMLKEEAVADPNRHPGRDPGSAFPSGDA